MTQSLSGRRQVKEETQSSDAGESTTTVIVAFCANLAIALAKSVVAAATGSASMLAEAAHSWADTGNQVLLLVADKKARRPADRSHPYGYGRDAYVWAMFAAMGLFVAGGAVSVWHGISELGATEEGHYTWAYVVLGLAFVFEGISFAQAYRQTSREAQRLDRHVIEHALATSDPTLRAVFAEDSAALIGLVIAALGIFLHQVTGHAVYDAVASILVGVLLLVVAVILIQRNRRFLTGEEGDPELRRAAVERLRGLPEIERVAYVHLEFVGPRKVLLVAAVDLAGDQPEGRLAYTLRDLEHRLEEDPMVVEAVLTLATSDEPSI